MTVGDLKEMLESVDEQARVTIADISDNYGYERRAHTVYKNMATGNIVIISKRRDGNVQSLCKPKENGDKRERCFG